MNMLTLFVLVHNTVTGSNVELPVQRYEAAQCIAIESIINKKHSAMNVELKTHHYELVATRCD